jgi:hypothetical protein
VYGFTLTPLPPQMFPQICESWLKLYLMQMCKQYHFALVEAVEPFKLASGYGWVTVMHEIPISSAHPLTSLPYPRAQ